MTMSSGLMEAMENRGLDVEALSRLGFDGGNREGTECLVIPFIRDGKIVRRKYKLFNRREDQSPYSQDPGGVRCAWNEDCLRDDSLLGHPLIITEGELDAAAALQCGFPRTISVPDGAPPPNSNKDDEDTLESRKYQWLRDIEPLTTKERVPDIILATDGDPNGAQLLHDLTLHLGKYRCKYITYPKAPVAMQERLGRERLKDLNEVLQFYGQKGLVETVNRAKFVKVSGVFRMSEFTPKPTPRVFEIQFDALSDHYRMRLGDFTVVTGVPSSGKTTWVQDAVCRVVERYGVSVAWGSFEQDPQTDHRRNFRRWYCRRPAISLSNEEKESADAWIERNHVFIVPDDEEDASLEWLVEKIETAVMRHGCQIVVIDPWNELEAIRDRGETMTEYVGRAIKTLKKVAKRLLIHLIIVAHPAKMQRGANGVYPMPSLYDISDSSHWFNKCDVGIVVHRETAEETVVKVAKSRHHEIIGTPGSVKMAFSRDEGRFVETERG